MADVLPGDGPSLRERVHQLCDACEALMQVLEDHPDAQAALDSATDLGETLRRLADRAAELRARIVERIYLNEKLTLTALGDRLSVSRARADQILKVARKSRERQGSVTSD
jgi:DNA-directed RNA polymerase sigma subunit (sigma70/sigma32)